VLGWLSRSKDEEYMGRVHKALKQGNLSLAGLLAETHLSRQQVEGALELLEGEGLVVGNVESGRRVYSRR
jgi:DNA-binding GntR family transcriptional regulator